MSRFDHIAANSRKVVGQSSETSGIVLQFRRLTSDYGIEPRTYSDWEEFTALPTSGMNAEVFDVDRGGHRLAYTARIRAADDSRTPLLKQGDQIVNAQDLVWAVMGVGSSGPGTVAYSVSKDRMLMGDQDRKGGV